MKTISENAPIKFYVQAIQKVEFRVALTTSV